jgi:2-phospho-L-lactate guanylyltransferase (CobY/MobA/RfbA family)
LNHASSAVLVDWPDGEVDIDTPSDIVTATESQSQDVHTAARVALQNASVRQGDHKPAGA